MYVVDITCWVSSHFHYTWSHFSLELIHFLRTDTEGIAKDFESAMELLRAQKTVEHIFIIGEVASYQVCCDL